MLASSGKSVYDSNQTSRVYNPVLQTTSHVGILLYTEKKNQRISKGKKR